MIAAARCITALETRSGDPSAGWSVPPDTAESLGDGRRTAQPLLSSHSSSPRRDALLIGGQIVGSGNGWHTCEFADATPGEPT
jgi:hypothetical protein